MDKWVLIHQRYLVRCRISNRKMCIFNNIKIDTLFCN